MSRSLTWSRASGIGNSRMIDRRQNRQQHGRGTAVVVHKREASEATAELLRIPNFLEDLKRAEQEVEAGLLTPVERLARKS